MATYFGNTTTAGAGDANAYNRVWYKLYAAPSGTWVLSELSAYVKVPGATPTEIRVAIYTEAGAFVAQTGAIAVSNTSNEWKGATTFVDQSKTAMAAPSITGGANYYICVSAKDGLECTVGYQSEAGTWLLSTDYSVGFPSTTAWMSGGSDPTINAVQRAGLDNAVTPELEAPTVGAVVLAGIVPSAAQYLFQHASPNGDIADGNWLHEGGTNVNMCFHINDGSVYDDADYIRSGATPANDTYICEMTPIVTPEAGTVTLKVRARYL